MNEQAVNVVTTCDITFDKLIGPLPVVTNIMDTMVMIGLRCSEFRPAIQHIKVDPKECDAASSQYCNWLFYVQSARSSTEQNLEVVTKQGQIYYRTLKNIKAHEELLVWYSKELAEVFQVPEVEELYDKGERKHCCPYCRDVFLFPNPLKTHLMYRCGKRLAEVHGLNSMSRLHIESINRLQLDLYSAAMLPVRPNLKGFSANCLTNNFLDLYRRVSPGESVNGEKENNQITMPVSIGSDALISEYVPSSNELAQKRKSEIQPHSTTKKLSSESNFIKSKLSIVGRSDDEMMKMKTAVVSAPMKLETSLQLSTVAMQHSGRKEPHRSPNMEIVSGGSAFKKVSKTTRPMSERILAVSSTAIGYNSHDSLSSLSGKSMYPMSYSLPLSTGSPPASSISLSSGTLNTSSIHSNWAVPIATSGPLAIVGPNSEQSIPHPQQQSTSNSFSIPNGFVDPKMNEITSSYSNAKLYEEIKHPTQVTDHLTAINMTNGIATAATETTDSSTVMVSYRNPLYSDSLYRLSVSLPYSKQFGTSLDNLMTKQSPPLSPITASLLPPSLAVLAFPSQNWCAKCNASFRMTSDLVYHMRSHHKREVDPLKKRREEKLKCSICSESFRERHHLTRHMTSHQ